MPEATADAIPKPKRIGLLGGSFDPVHRAHVELAKCAQQALALHEVQFWPARQPWQKPTLSASANDRLAMIKLAIDGSAGLTVNPIELERTGKTYTIDTLLALPDGHDYFWILGADQLLNFPTWHRWQDVAKRVTLVAAQRPGADLQIPAKLQALVEQGAANVQTLDFTPMDISATALRQAIAAHSPTDNWLDPKVATYIATHGLYQPNTASNT